MLKLYKDFGDLESHEINLHIAFNELHVYANDVSTELVLNYYGEYTHRCPSDYLDGYLKINLTGRNTGKITKIKYIHSHMKPVYVYNVEAFETNVSTEEELEEILTYVQDTLENIVVLTGLIATKRYKKNNFTLFVITDKYIPDDISKDFNTKFGGRPQITGRYWFEDDDEDDLPFEDGDLDEDGNLDVKFEFYFFHVRYSSILKSQLSRYISEKYKDIFNRHFLTHGYHKDGTNRCNLELDLYAKDVDALKKIDMNYLNKVRDDLLDFLNKIDTF